MPRFGSKAQFRDHAPVKHADDGQLGFRFAVEIDVLSDRMGAQPFADIIAPGADTGRIPKRFEPVLDLAEVFPFLCGPPLGPRIFAYPLEIAPGGPGYAKFPRTRQIIRPTPGPNSPR